VLWLEATVTGGAFTYPGCGRVALAPDGIVGGCATGSYRVTPDSHRLHGLFTYTIQGIALHVDAPLDRRATLTKPEATR